MVNADKLQLASKAGGGFDKDKKRASTIRTNMFIEREYCEVQNEESERSGIFFVIDEEKTVISNKKIKPKKQD